MAAGVTDRLWDVATLSRKSYKLGLKALWRISDDGCLPARIVDYLERGHMQQPRGCQFLEKQSRNHVLGLARSPSEKYDFAG